MLQRCLTIVCAVSVVGALAAPVAAMDDAHWGKAHAAIERGIAYLRATQNDDGSWSPQPGPAITAMAMTVMLDRPDTDVTDPAVSRALAYILSKQKPDGAIHDGILENYNTSICLSALARLRDLPDINEAIAKGQEYLKHLQWAGQQIDGVAVEESHPFYGGAGYGDHGRPDLSNTQMMIQALHDSGMDCDDPAYVRAMVFISRCQGVASNTAFGSRIVPDGGFIYATSIDKDHVGVPQSMASPEMVDEALAGRPVSGLRTYGSMTYAGFKSYLYAQLDRDDPRVTAAFHWIRSNYALDHNPGMRDNPATPAREDHQGLYYYYMTFARALKAWGAPEIEMLTGEKRDWANDLIDALVERQLPDGSWHNGADRWSEGDANLVTAYALIALTEAIR